MIGVIQVPLESQREGLHFRDIACSQILMVKEWKPSLKTCTTRCALDWRNLKKMPRLWQRVVKEVHNALCSERKFFWSRFERKKNPKKPRRVMQEAGRLGNYTWGYTTRIVYAIFGEKMEARSKRLKSWQRRDQFF